MSGTHYVKFWNQMFGSSLMQEDLHVRLVFFYMVLEADANGVVYGVVSSLARLFNIEEKLVQEALDRLGQPDPQSTHPDEGGRRIIAAPGNRWHIVNFQHFRELRAQEERREYRAGWIRNKRAAQKSTPVDSVDRPNVDSCRQPSTMSTKVVSSKKKEKYLGGAVQSPRQIQEANAAVRVKEETRLANLAAQAHEALEKRAEYLKRTRE